MRKFYQQIKDKSSQCYNKTMPIKPVYVWNGSAWVQVGDGTPSIQTNVNIADSAPDGALEGSLWFDSETNGLYAYDGTYWVSVQGAQGPTGPTGPQGATGPQGPAGSDADVTTASAAIVAAIVDGAPVALDTLNEIAAALEDNPDVLDLYITASSASSTYAPLNSPTFSGSADFSSATVVGIDALPSQTGNDGKYLKTDGTDATWETLDLDSKADKLLSINSITSSFYSLVLSDANKLIELNDSSFADLGIPLNSSVAFPIGTQITVLQVGTGQIGLSPASGVTLNATPGVYTRAQWSSVTLIKRDTDTWVAIGDLTA